MTIKQDKRKVLVFEHLIWAKIWEAGGLFHHDLVNGYAPDDVVLIFTAMENLSEADLVTVNPLTGQLMIKGW